MLSTGQGSTGDYGHRFTIYSDHKPLQHLFSENKTVPAMASARIQWWALTLGAYSYQITYKPGGSHSNADGLSRLPLQEHPSAIPLPGDANLLLDNLQSTPMTAALVKSWIDRELTLSRVRSMVIMGGIIHQKRSSVHTIDEAMNSVF